MTLNEPERRVSWMEYKTVRQYQAVGHMLDEFKVYGYRNGAGNMVQGAARLHNANGHDWLTEEPTVFEAGDMTA